MTFGALFVHGYHPWAEDAELYLPSVEKLLDPRLFPFNAQFFESHAHLTFFPYLIATSVRVSHLSLPFALFFWHLISIFLLLLACQELAGKCFTSSRVSSYGAVALLAALLTLPVAGTALYIMDQYLNPRNLAASLAVLSILKLLDRKYVPAALLLFVGAAIHPLMSAFAVAFCLLLFCLQNYGSQWGLAAYLLPLGILDPPTAAYHQAVMSHSYFYLLRWHWYEWLGAIGPMMIFAWVARIARVRKLGNLELLSRTLVVYQTVFVIIAVILTVPARFESLARLQPMRSLYLSYLLLVLFSGGLLAEYALKNRWWRWMVLFLPLCAGMFYAQRGLFPASVHIEWPGLKPRNPWIQAFEWVRGNTPRDAIFALDPYYMHIAGEDENGFRAVAERSRLADALTDSGAVSMFPPLAGEWLAQVQTQAGWREFGATDFHRLQLKYGLNWVVLQQSQAVDLQCPYQNPEVKVCRLD